MTIINRFSHLSEGEREQIQQKALESRCNSMAEGRAKYKQDWSDDAYWQELAKKYNVRLPQHHTAPSGGKLKSLAAELGLVEGTWEEGFFGENYKNVSFAITRENAMRPEGQAHGQRAFVGWLLEYIDTYKQVEEAES